MSEQHKRGRPETKPFSEFEKLLILALYGEGKIDAEVAEILDMPRSTFLARCKKFSDFSATIKATKDNPNKEVKLSLFKLALGYEYTERVERPGETETRHKHQPANVSACMYWLNNRQSEEWKAVQYVRAEVSKSEDHDFSPAELARIAAGDDPLKILKERRQA